MDWMFVPLSNSYVDALTPNVMVFGGGLLEGNYVKMKSRGQESHSGSALIKWGRDIRALSCPQGHAPRKGCVGTQWEGGHLPGRGLSPESDTLISDLQPPELWKINACCLSHPVRYFVMAAQADWDEDFIDYREPVSLPRITQWCRYPHFADKKTDSWWSRDQKKLIKWQSQD